MDKLFDVFNSKYIEHANISKKVLNHENKIEIFQFLEETIKYLKSLKIDEERFYISKSTGEKVKIIKPQVPILKSSRKAAFRGFIVDAKSIMLMYAEYVEEKQLLQHLSTYLLQQDVIELFFGRIRSMNGHNNNPNIYQFKGAYRKLASAIKIASPENGNCRHFNSDIHCLSFSNYSNIYDVSSMRPRFVPTDKFEEMIESQQQNILEEVQQLNELEGCNPLLDSTSNFSVATIASSIENRIERKEKFRCNNCRNVFANNDKITIIQSAALLTKPCKSTFDICKTANQFLKLYDVSTDNKKYDMKVIYCLIFRALDFNTLFTKSTFDCDINHKYQFIKCIVQEFVAMKALYDSKQLTLNQQKHVYRQRLTRLVTSNHL